MYPDSLHRNAVVFLSYELCQHTKLLAERLNVTEKDVVEIGKAIDSPDISLDAPLGDSGDSGSTIDLIADASQNYVEEVETGILREFISDKIDMVRDKLSEKELFILDHRLLSEYPMTLQDIGNKYGVTKEAIRLNEASLLKKLKKIFLQHSDLRNL